MSNAHQRLLPSNATPFELLFDEANDPIANVGTEFSGLPGARQTPPPQVLPFLVWQLGLGELTPYLPNLYSLIGDGVRWQRIRGTPGAIRKGLGWIGHDFLEIEEETARYRDFPEAGAARLRWSRNIVELDRVRDADFPDLERIAGIGQLSLPKRSYFSRAHRGYDVRAGETSFQRTSACLTGDHSGVFVGTIPTQWSFGRRYENTATLSEANLTALETWIEPVPEAYTGPWADVDDIWSEVDELWSISDNLIRSDLIADALLEFDSVWVRFRDADNAIIGHARATTRKVAGDATGEYQIGTASHRVVASNGEAVIVHARTGFSDGSGASAASMSVVFDSALAAGSKPGALWLGPAGISGGVEVASANVNIPFGLTVRERCVFLMRFL